MFHIYNTTQIVQDSSFIEKHETFTLLGQISSCLTPYTRLWLDRACVTSPHTTVDGRCMTRGFVEGLRELCSYHKTWDGWILGPARQAASRNLCRRSLASQHREIEHISKYQQKSEIKFVDTSPHSRCSQICFEKNDIFYDLYKKIKNVSWKDIF